MTPDQKLAPFLFLAKKSEKFSKQVCLTLRPMTTKEYLEEDLHSVAEGENQLLRAFSISWMFTVKHGNFNRDGYFDEMDENTKVFTLFLSEIPLITMMVEDIRLSDAEMELCMG